MSTHPFTIPEDAEVTTRSAMGGVQHQVTFANDYGASIICHDGSYGGPQGLWEIGVVHNGGLTYATPITSDVLGYLTAADVNDVLVKIAALPEEVAA